MGYNIILAISIFIAFYMGSKTNAKEKVVETPKKRLNIFKRDKKENKNEVIDLETENFQISMENLENYDGTPNSQKDLMK